MDMSNPVLLWAGIGTFLILSELLLPGGIVIMLGIACLLVALATFLGLVVGLSQGLTLWFISSILLLLAFRSITQGLIGGDCHVDNTDEDLDLVGQYGVVKQTIGPDKQLGRVAFQGTDWPAVGNGGEILPNTTVRITGRENIALIVEPV